MLDIKELKMIRELLGYSQQECAKDMKTSKQIIHNIEIKKSTDAMTLAYEKYLLEHRDELYKKILEELEFMTELKQKIYNK